MKILREPLLHFLLLGAAIFAIFGLVTRHSTDKPGEIVVTQGTVENLVTGFTRTWQRPPTDAELQGLVRDYVREEAAYREALALGLDRDDMIVRRRLRQKLEFLSDDLADRTEPTDAQLTAFLQAHSSFFRSEPLISFRQIYFNPQLHGGKTTADVGRVLNKLHKADAHLDTAALGDPFLLQESFDNISLSDAKKTFGENFAAAIAAARIGEWEGPVSSGYGVHLIYVGKRTAGRVPVLTEVRDQVRREYLAARRNEITERFYQALLQRYTVKIEPLEQKKLAKAY